MRGGSEVYKIEVLGKTFEVWRRLSLEFLIHFTFRFNF